MKMLSKSSLYGIKALLYLAEEQGNNFIPINNISEQLNIPFHYLTKIFQMLSKCGFIESQKGSKGGVKLIKSPCMISLGEIIKAIDTESFYFSNDDLDNYFKFKKLNFLLKYGNDDRYKSIYETTLDNLLC